jgi:hypothetical protein
MRDKMSDADQRPTPRYRYEWVREILDIVNNPQLATPDRAGAKESLLDEAIHRIQQQARENSWGDDLEDVQPNSPSGAKEVLASIRREWDTAMLMYNEPDFCGTEHERGVKVEILADHCVGFTLFNSNCPEPWYGSMRVSLLDAKEVAKWITRRSNQYKPSLPVRAYHAAARALGPTYYRIKHARLAK